MTTTERLAALVRGDAAGWAAWDAVDEDAFCAAAEHHGVLPLVAERSRAASGVPAALAARLADQARRHAAADLEREAELRAAIAALDRAGVRPIVFKGAHLAYRDYARPDLRPRLDSDVLIAPDTGARDAAHRALGALGYDTPPHVGGDLVMTQRMYVRRSGDRVRHALDVHWRIATPQAFARVLTHDDLWRDAEPVAALGPAARGPCGAHALLIACLHRVAHHAGSDCLIWLRDIDLVARRLSPADWAHVARLAAERQVRGVCEASLSAAASRFATPVPAGVFEALRATAAAKEASAAYLRPPGDSLGAALEDWRALSSWRERLRLVREHALPPVEYMRRVYAPQSRAPVAWLYARRLWSGARKWRRRR